MEIAKIKIDLLSILLSDIGFSCIVYGIECDQHKYKTVAYNFNLHDWNNCIITIRKEIIEVIGNISDD